ncbi:MAG: hypothetical protein K8R92_01965 [Planctomycetes bacterium]|nr:hypothetical protein [Planctomycetota bacterium]
MSDLQDEIARRAAGMMAQDQNIPVKDAIAQAIDRMGLSRSVTPPSVDRVRLHAEGLARESLGDQGYEDRRYQRMVAIIDLIRRLERDFPGARVALIGRACDGHFDADPQVHLRFVGEAPIHRIADALVRGGFPEPEVRSLASRVGMLDQVHSAFEFAPLTLTRCPPKQLTHPGLDLRHGRPIQQKTLLQLEEMLAKPRRPSQRREERGEPDL